MSRELLLWGGIAIRARFQALAGANCRETESFSVFLESWGSVEAFDRTRSRDRPLPVGHIRGCLSSPLNGKLYGALYTTYIITPGAVHITVPNAYKVI